MLWHAAHGVCKTVNRLNSHGDSVVVNKMCAQSSRCTMQHVGCRSVSYLTNTVVCWPISFYRAMQSGVTQPSGPPRHFLRSGPLPSITKNSRTVGGPLPPVGPPSLDAAATPSLRHWMQCMRDTSHGPVCVCLSVCHKSEFY